MGQARPLIEFRSISKTFGGVTAVDGVTLSIHPGEFFALLGPSGCGKTTLMRLLAGFEMPDAGDILLDGVSLIGMPPHRRPINMMFQSYALFPHMRVSENIAFGLKQEGLPRSEITHRVDELLALVKLDGLGQRKPAELSGGQRQRVALARALARHPKVLLLDEPLSALDRKLREATQHELKELQSRLGTTFLMVTHDQEEAMTMADRIAVMDRGHIIQVATPRDLYETPINRQIAEFLGDANILEAEIVAIEDGNLNASSPIGPLQLSSTTTTAAVGTPIWIALRPEKLCIARAAPKQADNKVQGQVSAIRYFGGVTMLEVAIAEHRPALKVSTANTVREAADTLAVGEPVWLSWSADAGVLLKD